MTRLLTFILERAPEGTLDLYRPFIPILNGKNKKLTTSLKRAC